MRRAVSISVLLVILTSILAPMAQARSSNVPACCRAGGKHHCDGSMGASGSFGFKSAPETCSYRHQAAVTSAVVALTSSGHHIAIFVIAGKTVRPQVATIYSSDPNDAHKRGPPAA
jgi:hypothetical protein